MAAVLHLLDQRRLIDSNGIADGGSIRFYLTGTTTPTPVYTSSALTTPVSQPIVVGAGAEVPYVYLDSTITYKRVITYPDGSTDTADPYNSYTAGLATLAQLADVGGADLIGTANGITVQDAFDALETSTAPVTTVLPRPTGFSALPFLAWYGADGRVQTEYDDPAIFREAMLPDWIGDTSKNIGTLYLDPDVTNIQTGASTANNDALSFFYAAPDWATVKGQMIAQARDAYVVYAKGRAKAYGDKGPGFGGSADYPYAVIGVPDDKGNRPIFSVSAYASLLTWTDNATYDWVNETPIAGMTNTGLWNASSFVVDVRFRDLVRDAAGNVHRVPRRYTAVTTLALCAKTPGSYWWDAGASKFYLHAIGGSKADPNPYEVLIVSAVNTVYPNIYPSTSAAQKQGYVEGVDVVGRFNLTKELDRAAALDCRSFYSTDDGFPAQNIATYIKDCVSYGAALDAFSEANSGGTLSNPKTYHFDPIVLGTGTSEGSQQAFSAHGNQEVTTLNPVSSNPWRNQIVDIETAKRHMVGGILHGTKLGGSIDLASNANVLVNSTNSAVIALDGVKYGGYYETAMFKADGSSQIRYKNMAIPAGVTSGTVTSAW